jgi:hypothetical protein
MKNILLIAACIFLASCALQTNSQSGATRTIVFEGARLITGNGSPPIENSAFVVQGGLFGRVGRRGEVPIPNGAQRIDLTGKTIIPAKVDLHGHIGYQHDFDGTMAKDYFTRDNLIDHLQRLAYFGVSAVIGIGDLRRSVRLEGWKNEVGRCASSRPRRNCAWRRPVSNGRYWNRLAGFRSQWASIANGCAIPGHNRG